MKGWRDIEDDSEEFKLFRQIFLFGSCVRYMSTGPDVIRGWSKEEKKRVEMKKKKKEKNSSPSLLAIRRLNPVCDRPVSAGDRIEHSR